MVIWETLLGGGWCKYKYLTMDLRKLILEILDTVVSDYEIKVKPHSGNISVYFSVDKEKYEINFSPDVEFENAVYMDFQRWGGEEEGYGMSYPSGHKHSPIKIFSSIVYLTKIVLQKNPNIHYIFFNTNKDFTSKVKLYNSLVNKFIKEGIVRYVDKNSSIYKHYEDVYPQYNNGVGIWVLEVIR